MAKNFGSYNRLESGDPKEALIDLTGHPTLTYHFYD